MSTKQQRSTMLILGMNNDIKELKAKVESLEAALLSEQSRANFYQTKYTQAQAGYEYEQKLNLELQAELECKGEDVSLTADDLKTVMDGTELDILEWAEGLRKVMDATQPVLDAWSKMNALVASKEWDFRLEHNVLEDVWYAQVSIAGVGYEDYGLLAVDAINTLAKRVEEDRSIQVVVRD